MDPTEQNWVVIQKMAGEVKKAGLPMGNLVRLLRDAKAVLNECRLDEHSRGELLPRASMLVEEAQREIFSIAGPLGPDFEKKWMEILKRVLKGEKIGEFTVTGSSKFYPNRPKNKDWVRVRVPASAREKLGEIENSSGVEIRPDGDEHILIMGDKASIQRALEELSPYFREKD